MQLTHTVDGAYGRRDRSVSKKREASMRNWTVCMPIMMTPLYGTRMKQAADMNVRMIEKTRLNNVNYVPVKSRQKIPVRRFPLLLRSRSQESGYTRANSVARSFARLQLHQYRND